MLATQGTVVDRFWTSLKGRDKICCWTGYRFVRKREAKGHPRVSGLNTQKEKGGHPLRGDRQAGGHQEVSVRHAKFQTIPQQLDAQVWNSEDTASQLFFFFLIVSIL